MIDLDAARSFVLLNARLLDRAYLAHLLGEGSVSYTHLTLPTTPYV